MINNIKFKYVTKDLEKEAKEFIISEYFKHYNNRLENSRYQYLYKKMETLLLNKEENAFFVALHNKEVIGTISVNKYDNRIKILKDRYNNKKIAEIGRCYVKKQYRRFGIASKLLKLATDFANAKKYNKLYLHTHYFLPGGFQFWSKMEFVITHNEKDVLQTVHLEKDLNPTEKSTNLNLIWDKR